MITVRPSSSFSLTVPDGIIEDVDGRASSYWFLESPTLLQLSSYIRVEGPQVSAAQRLKDRMEATPGDWKIWAEPIHPNRTIDQAAAQYVDEDSVKWVHAYLVWPHLAIFVTISGSEGRLNVNEDWPFQSLRSIALTTH
jgi:hypothetical protein